MPRWIALLRQRSITRGKVFDLLLVAGMLGNGVTRVYTYNRKDFEVVEGVEVLTP